MLSDVEYTENLLKHLQERLNIVQKLYELSESQSSAGDQTDVNVTLGLLARKQSLIEDLNAVASSLAPYFQDDPEQRVWLSVERRKQCREIAEQGSERLKQLLLTEQRSLDQLSSRRDAVAAQLQDGKDSILASTAYMSDGMLNQSSLDIGDL